MNIYYCWFGGQPLTDEIKSMIQTWKMHFPDNTIIEINEDNFDIDSYPYAKSAYDAKKYAFVSDCARAHFLFYEGGYYFDTDVEVRKAFDPLFAQFGIVFKQEKPQLLMAMEYFSYEITGVSTAIILSDKGHPLLGDLLQYYSGNTFDDILEPETINQKMNKLLSKKTLFTYKNKEQHLAYDGANVALVSSKLLMQDKKRAYAVHHLDGSWQNSLSIGRKIRRIFGIIVKKVIGRERFERLWEK